MDAHTAAVYLNDFSASEPSSGMRDSMSMQVGSVPFRQERYCLVAEIPGELELRRGGVQKKDLGHAVTSGVSGVDLGVGVL